MNEPTVVRTERGLSIAGTRITLYSIMDYVKAGWPPKLIRDLYNLTDEQIADVMAYLEEHAAEVEVEYQEALREAEENRRYWEEQERERRAKVGERPQTPEQAAVRAKLEALKKQRSPS